MDLLVWITIGFIISGFVALVSKKKTMENELVFIKANMESEESLIKTKSLVWWIVITGAWGIVSIILIVWSFHNHFG